MNEIQRRRQRQLEQAAKQWRDEDLEELRALLDKDYTAPQQSMPRLTQDSPNPARQAPEDDLADIRQLLEPQKKAAPVRAAVAAPEEDDLAELRSILNREHAPRSMEPLPRQPKVSPMAAKLLEEGVSQEELAGAVAKIRLLWAAAGVQALAAIGLGVLWLVRM